MIVVIKKEHCTIRMHIPDLAPEERDFREKQMRESVKRFFMAYEKGKVRGRKDFF